MGFTYSGASDRNENLVNDTRTRSFGAAMNV